MRQELCEFEVNLDSIVKPKSLVGGREEVKKEGRKGGEGRRRKGGRERGRRGGKETISNREDYANNPFKMVLNVEGKNVRN